MSTSLLMWQMIYAHYCTFRWIVKNIWEKYTFRTCRKSRLSSARGKWESEQRRIYIYFEWFVWWLFKCSTFHQTIVFLWIVNVIICFTVLARREMLLLDCSIIGRSHWFAWQKVKVFYTFIPFIYLFQETFVQSTR